MSRFSRFFTAITFATIGIGASRNAQAITFGEADGDDHPATGALAVEFPEGWGFPNCSGSLVYVDEEAGYGLFLTAGHCTASLQAYVDAGILADFGVNFDEFPSFFDPITYSATGVWTLLTDTSATTKMVDLGLIRFEFDDASALPEPVQLAGDGFLDGLSQSELLFGTFLTVGYGATVDRMGGDYYYEDRRQVASPQYLNLIGTMVKMNQAGAAGNGGGCYADSGGPLFWVDEDGEETVVAVTRGGHAACYSYGLFNRIDNAQAHAFIASGMD